MIHVPVVVANVIWVVVNPITVPVSVLFPGSGVGAGLERGRGVVIGLVAAVAGVVVVAVGAQLTRSGAVARIQM
jgi:hypothetical protein